MCPASWPPVSLPTNDPLHHHHPSTCRDHLAFRLSASHCTHTFADMPNLAKRLSISFSSRRDSIQSVLMPIHLEDEETSGRRGFDIFPVVPVRDALVVENLPTPQDYAPAGLSPKSLPSRLRSATMTRSSAQSQNPQRKSRHEVHSFAEEEEADQTTPELIASKLFGNVANSRYSSSGSSSSSSSSKCSLDTDSWVNSLGLCQLHDDDNVPSQRSSIAELEAELYADLLLSASIWGADEKIEQAYSRPTTPVAPIMTPSRSSSSKRRAPAAREKYESRPLPDAPTDVRRDVPTPAVRPTFSRQSSNLSIVSCPAPIKEEEVPIVAELTCNGRVMEISGRASVELSSRWSMDSEPEERLRLPFKPAALVGHFRSGSPAPSTKSSFRHDRSRTPAMSRTSSTMSTISVDTLATVSDSTIPATEQVFDLTRPNIDYRTVYNLANEYVQVSSDTPTSESMHRSNTLPSQPVPTSKNIALKLLTKHKKSPSGSSKELKDRTYQLRRLA